MMNYALFTGCQIPENAPQYETAARKVLEALEVGGKELPFNCCGYPMRDLYFDSFLLASGKNLALAESKGLNILTLCKCCLGTLKRAQTFLDSHDNLRKQVNDELKKEGLVYSGNCQVEHLQSVLYHQLGVEFISDRVTRPFSGLKVAAMYGCHALRPSRVTGFDSPYDPHIIDDLLKAIGIQSVPWDGRLKCCGAPLRHKNPALSLTTIQERLTDCNEAGAHILGVDCPHTLAQVGWAFENFGAEGLGDIRGVALYPQLLGLALGMEPAELGLDDNCPRSGCVANYLEPTPPPLAAGEQQAEPGPEPEAEAAAQ